MTERTDYAFVTHKPKPMDVSAEDLYGYGAQPAPPAPTGRLGQFETAVREFVDAVEAGAELDQYVKRFKELLA